MTENRVEPSFAELLDWLEGRMDPSEDSSIARRVAEGDRSTHEKVEWISGFLRLSDRIKRHR